MEIHHFSRFPPTKTSIWIGNCPAPFHYRRLISVGWRDSEGFTDKDSAAWKMVAVGPWVYDQHDMLHCCLVVSPIFLLKSSGYLGYPPVFKHSNGKTLALVADDFSIKSPFVRDFPVHVWFLYGCISSSSAWRSTRNWKSYKKRCNKRSTRRLWHCRVALYEGLPWNNGCKQHTIIGVHQDTMGNTWVKGR